MVSIDHILPVQTGAKKAQSCNRDCQLPEEKVDLASHWNRAFAQAPENKLGWYESDLSPSLNLFEKAGLSKEAKILVAGAGNTRLIDELLNNGYSNVIANDISEKALEQLAERVGGRARYIADDLTKSTKLTELGSVDLWFDRAVLHFFTKENDRQAYRKLLLQLVKKQGYVALAEFAEDGALKCSGLDILRYSFTDMQSYLGEEFAVVDQFKHLYTMPSGDNRKYNYALFQRLD